MFAAGEGLLPRIRPIIVVPLRGLPTTNMTFPEPSLYKSHLAISVAIKSQLIGLPMPQSEKPSFNMKNEELFNHEAYIALIPHIDRQNIDPWTVPYETAAELIEPLPSRTLIIVSLQDADFIELCQQMGADRTGTVMAHNEPNGFRWAYLERRR